MIREVEGDLIEMAAGGRFDVIAHGCNCMCTMGKGIAAAIRERFPAAWEADRQTTKGDRSKLGTCIRANFDIDGRTLMIVNAYTQFDYRGSGMKADYVAIEACLSDMASRFGGSRFGLPRIGAGLAGGDWVKINRIIETVMAGQDATIVTLPLREPGH